MDLTLEKKLDDLKPHLAYDALVLLRASCNAPTLMYVMRSSPCAGHILLSDVDNSLRLTLSNITNIKITDEQWRQASLPVKAGGIGVRSVISIAPPAFLSSSTSTQQLQALLVGKCTWQLSAHHFDNVMDDWCQRHYPVLPPTGTSANKLRF